MSSRVRQNIKHSVCIAFLLSFGLLAGCSQYKSSWSCQADHGIGCSSIGYADQVARKHIILNTVTATDKKPVITKSNQSASKKNKTLSQQNKTLIKGTGIQQVKPNKPTMLIREHYSDFEKVESKEVEID